MHAYLGSRVEVANGIGLKVIFVLPAQHSCDDDDDERYHGNGGQHRRKDPKVVRRILDHR
jgi:hypothetical protein